MRKDEFLRMMVQDNETESDPNKKALYADVIECMDIALSQSPATFDIPSDKTLKGAFELIEKRGRELKKMGSVLMGAYTCVGPFEAAEIIAEYLGAKYERATKKYAKPPKVNLDDLLD